MRLMRSMAPLNCSKCQLNRLDFAREVFFGKGHVRTLYCVSKYSRLLVRCFYFISVYLSIKNTLCRHNETLKQSKTFQLIINIDSVCVNKWQLSHRIALPLKYRCCNTSIELNFLLELHSHGIDKSDKIYFKHMFHLIRMDCMSHDEIKCPSTFFSRFILKLLHPLSCSFDWNQLYLWAHQHSPQNQCRGKKPVAALNQYAPVNFVNPKPLVTVHF